MSGKQERLAAAVQGFTPQLDALRPAVDYQVGVTTTTVSKRLGACGLAGNPAAAAQCDSDWEAQGFACDDGLACSRSSPALGSSRRSCDGTRSPRRTTSRRSSRQCRWT